MNSETLELPAISQQTIECDLRAFTRWLNDVKDQVNWLTNVYVALKAQVEENTEQIRLLKIRMTNVENRVTAVENRLTVVEGDVAQIKVDLQNLTAVVQAVSDKLDLLYTWLPVPYGTIDPRGWKFAMGNINTMSANNGTPSISGPGIFTSGNIEDNDIYFN